MENEREGLRLQVYLARAGIASRRACETYIARGRVRVNGRTVREQGVKVGPGDEVFFDGKPVHGRDKPIYLALHKPPRYLCTNSDPQGRPLAVDLVRKAYPGRLYTVGRLDFLSSGLIIITNDGAFAAAVSHPSRAVEKEYLVETKRDIPERFLEDYVRGLTVEGESYRLKSYRYKNERSVLLVLEEGKNREIRRVFGSHMLFPKRVHRLRIGRLTLRGLEAGAFRPLSVKEIEGLRRTWS